MSESRLFVVVRTHGGAWKPGLPADQQYDVKGHSDFLNRLLADGFLVAAGPLEGTDDAMLLVRARDAEEIRDRLQWDSWSANDLLRTKSIQPWGIRFGAIAANRP